MSNTPRALLSSLVVAAFSLSAPTLAIAQHSTTSSHVELTAGTDNLDAAWGQASVRKGTSSGHQLGLSLRGGAIRYRFVGGYVTESGASTLANVHARWLLAQNNRASFQLDTGLGASGIFSSEPTAAGDAALAVAVLLAPRVTLELTDRVELFGSVNLNVEYEVSPGAEIALQETPYEVGLRYWVNDKLALGASGFVGGAFGYVGDGAKHRAGANVGVVYAFDDKPDKELEEFPKDRDGPGAFVSMSWRGMMLGEHLGHGPGFQAGVSLLGGKLKLGVAGFNRPGPLNPRTFEVTPSDGQTYKGEETITLRSDGGMAGAMAAVHLPLSESLALEVPLTVGQAGFGFYLFDEDRETPDGRRVSEWENDLQGNIDAGFAVGVDAGVRLMATPRAMPWLRPFVGVHYTVTPGYRSFVRDNYRGASIAVGTELAVF